MIKHANLYFLFLEEREANPINAEKNKTIRQNIENFYKSQNLNKEIKNFKKGNELK